MGEVLITKANGERVPFEPLKLERSLRGAGASQLLIEEIVAEVRGELEMASHPIGSIAKPSTFFGRNHPRSLRVTR